MLTAAQQHTSANNPANNTASAASAFSTWVIAQKTALMDADVLATLFAGVDCAGRGEA